MVFECSGGVDAARPRENPTMDCVPPVFAGNASIAASSSAKYPPKVSHMLLLLGLTMA
jgi:hypothetical protein